MEKWIKPIISNLELENTKTPICSNPRPNDTCKENFCKYWTKGDMIKFVGELGFCNYKELNPSIS